MKDQFDEAAMSTSRALSHVRQQRTVEDGEGAGTPVVADDLADKKDADDKKMAPEIECMQPILRFLQLLCENHNRDLQVRCSGQDAVIFSRRNSNMYNKYFLHDCVFNL